ncbi:MAG: peptidase M19 [Chloroflexi bacterium]|nr:peptidase M19 [Chloroflexota bacterium]
MPARFIIADSHQDIAWNMQVFGRDYTRSVEGTRRLERGTDAPLHNGDTLLGWDAYQDGRVALVFATLFACPVRYKEGDWDKLCYADMHEAYELYRSQIDVYHRLVQEEGDKFRLIQTRGELRAHLEEWQQPTAKSSSGYPVGLLILMEGAEAVRELAELEEWWQLGVRAISPAWAGTRFCGGTKEPGPLTKKGYALLDVMADLGFILDLSHMDEEAALQALDHYPGRIIASHANAKALLKGADSNRHLSDRIIEGIFERDGVIGVVPFNLFLHPDWTKGGDQAMVSLQRVADQIDYMCQIAGDARHVGIGSDFDGGFGLQSVPHEIDTLADLQKLSVLLGASGYQDENIAAIMGMNWLNLLSDNLPES